MFKNMLKRSWLSIARKPSRTIILTIIFFVMANMMLATIAIKASVGESVKYAKDSLGGTVYLQADMDAMRENMAPPTESSGTTSTTTGRIERPSIPLSMAEEIADSEYVKEYTYSINGRADANDLELVETTEQQMFQQFGGRGMEGGPSFNINTEDGATAISTNNVTIIGINSFAFISEVESGTMELESGEIFDETTDGGIMISYELAQLNGLSVGDKITLTTSSFMNSGDDGVESVELTIIGLYDVSEDSFDANTIYMNPATAAVFSMDDSTDDSGELTVQSVKYYLTSAEHKDAFIAEADKKYPSLSEDGLALSIDDSAYQQMVGPIESVGGFATTILWVVMIAAVIIITLIVTINIKDRRYEMGVLLSLGASKLNILGQFIVELVVVGTVAFVLSIGTSTFIAKALGSSLLDNQIAMSEQQSEQNFGRGSNAGGPTMGSGGGMTRAFGRQSSSDVETISEIDVSVSPSDYAILFAAGYLIIILSLVVPSINILRYQPKTILTGKE
ncbi:FtsX-like permease family protein [Christensenellaceae bacterium OttesenSCG-928-L17]|nr:FtsX-like permease family protein [Christensenellaceae bacterium OttesenSCG-928-L17]